MSKRRWLFKLHTWLALIAAIPLLISCLTGAILVFKYEIDSLLRPAAINVEQVLDERQSLDQLRSTVQQQFPAHEITGWTLFQQPQRADVVYLIAHGSSDWQHIYIDAYQGRVLTEPALATTHFTDWLLELHYHLLLDHTGLLIAALASSMLCMLGISGLFIYRQFWANLLRLRWRAARLTLYVDTHSSFGMTLAPVMIIVGFTGAYWNFIHLIEEGLVHDDHAAHIVTEPMYEQSLSLQQLRQQAESSIDGFAATYISLPWAPGAQITFYGDVHDTNALTSQYASKVSFDPNSGQRLQVSDIRQESIGRRIDDSFRRLHFGDFAGLFSKAIWALAGLLVLWLTYTGLYVWWTKQKTQRQARQRQQQRAAATLSAQP
ncbi:hypothetical protein CHH28_01830 [Bacterioplanes sanyensis]|uniref:Cellulose-binding protein n=1 Tax=Bacterioplanes sanyensis TaxID=1249553 RepID=A0A222FEQ2_9GAMM|nr:PepSY-associated TM helix domain-containing protein [Bacterioplanes sanyensis]ASP37488.1 hypothetical protein CHH28_01830 [Bacterioplanes sanyensis]